MIRRIVFVQTVLSVVSQFTDLARELLPPDVETWHIADELLAKVVAQGGLSPSIDSRARAAQDLNPAPPIPILTSPRLAVEQLASLVRKL
jgi:hypothetical protein